MKKPILTIAIVGALFTAASAQQQQGNQQAVRPAGTATAQPAAPQAQPKEAQAATPAATQTTAAGQPDNKVTATPATAESNTSK